MRKFQLESTLSIQTGDRWDCHDAYDAKYQYASDFMAHNVEYRATGQDVAQEMEGN